MPEEFFETLVGHMLIIIKNIISLNGLQILEPTRSSGSGQNVSGVVKLRIFKPMIAWGMVSLAASIQDPLPHAPCKKTATRRQPLGLKIPPSHRE